jgi:hypothetical protein
MRTKSARTFFVNGHKCEIRCERREHYTGWVDGEKIESGHNTKWLREELISDAKYRPEVQADFGEIAEAVYHFVKAQTDRDGNPLWVHNDVIIKQVTPTETVGDAYSALLKLEGFGYVEKGEICMDLNAEPMWRAVPSVEDTRCISNFEHPAAYES